MAPVSAPRQHCHARVRTGERLQGGEVSKAADDARRCRPVRIGAETQYARESVPEHVGLWTVPNGIDAEYYDAMLARQRVASNTIILCGSLSVFRNRLAASWFARAVFPLVRKETPNAEFWIVGSDPSREILDLEKIPGVYVTGTVEDARPYYARSAVAVAPYRFGEGTKLKVLEAMASRTPLVSTPIRSRALT